jgi:YidC/Oxa1 family membrane protein insertase
MVHILGIIFYNPLYNLLLLIISVMPHYSVGLAIVLITVIIKLALFPLTQKAVYSQMEMKELEPELAEIKKKYPEAAEQYKQTQILYKAKGVNPYSSCLPLLIQTPFLIAIYIIFQKGFATISGKLYSFVHVPAAFNLHFLGLFDLGQKSIGLAILAGITTFIQSWLAQKRTGKVSGGDSKAQFAQTLQTQMMFMMPVLIAYGAYRFSAAVALYWVTSNVFTIGQEIYTKNKMKGMVKKTA